MLLTTKSGRMVELPSDDEDAAINVGIANDSDTYELSDAEFLQLKRLGRPPATVTKERITIRLSSDVVRRFRATGKGWQTRIDDALKDWINTHPA